MSGDARYVRRGREAKHSKLTHVVVSTAASVSDVGLYICTQAGVRIGEQARRVQRQGRKRQVSGIL